ncbi:MAG: response regulator [Psychrosphaera sp.]|nr:response regulator [Psychrosphaera sp.]
MRISLDDTCAGFDILVVDDEPVNLEIVCNHLATSRCAVQTVTSGQQALDVIIKRKPNLVLLDVMMPGLDGYQTCKKIREHYSVFELPVIFLTARVQLKDLVDAFDAGGNDYLGKPFFKDELLARVQIQVELTIGRQRMAQLRHFANNISQYRSHEDMAKAAYETLLPDAIVEKSALFLDGAVQLNSHDDFNVLPALSTQTDELLVEQDGQVSQYLPLSEHYILAAKFPKSSSEDWLRNLVSQLQKSMEQVRRIVSDPEINLIQSVIKPRMADIFYISVEKNYCSVFIEQNNCLKEEVHRIPLRQLLLYLDKTEITQVSRSVVVNSNKISGFDKTTGAVILQGKEKIPVSKKYLYEMKKSHPTLFAKVAQPNQKPLNR